MEIKRIIPKVALSIGVFGYLFFRYFKFIAAYTQDLGRHLLTGEIILESWSIPKINLFSYTYPDFPFINHHYLSEVAMFLTYKFLGNNGIQILAVVTILAAFAIVFFYSARNYTFLITSLASLLYIGILVERTDIRPEIFSFLFLSIFITILFKNRERFTRHIYLLPIIMIVWVNTHIYFFVGIVILILFVIDAFIQRKEILRSLLMITLLSICSLLINPNFIEGALYPLNVFNNYGYTIEENQSVFLLESLGFEKNSVVFLKIASFFLFVLLVLNYKKTRLIDWLLALTFTYAAFVAVRNLPLFVFATIIPFSKSLVEVSDNSLKRLFNRYTFIEIAMVVFILVVFLWQSYIYMNKYHVGFGVELGAERGVDFFVANDIRGPIFNNFDIGSYLLYRLYPEERVFIDGRPEAYPKAFIQNEYIPMQDNAEIFERVDDKYKFQVIFFSHTDMTPWALSFISEIVKNPKWRTVYLDDTSIILVKMNGVNANLVKKYGMIHPIFKTSSLTDQSVLGQLKLANFFQTTNAVENQIDVYNKILVLQPNYCPAIYNLAVLLAQRSHPSAQIMAMKYQSLCNK